jgi:hypothetical protein
MRLAAGATAVVRMGIRETGKSPPMRAWQASAWEGATGGRAAAGYPMVFLMMPISFSGSKGLRTNATASLIA